MFLILIDDSYQSYELSLLFLGVVLDLLHCIRLLLLLLLLLLLQLLLRQVQAGSTIRRW